MAPESALKIGMFLHQPKQFSARSGMFPLAEVTQASAIFYEYTWRKLMQKSWTMGQALRIWGNRYYGSEWNALAPWLDEWTLYRKMPKHLDIAHFLWGEFAGPSCRSLFRKKARRLVGTYHASARKLPMVLKNQRSMKHYDAITLMSRTQRPFFEAQGIPEERIHVILHGVDTSFFCPPEDIERSGSGPLRGLLVGYTERDHAFMAEVLKRVPPDILNMKILAPAESKRNHYRDISLASFPEHLTDEGLRCSYQEADVLIMPMIDCTANNAVMESMSCGTPVLVNRVGGIPEYVDEACNWVLEDKIVEVWVEKIEELYHQRERLAEVRPRVRAWAEQFSWAVIAEKYLAMYKTVLDTSVSE